MKNAHRQLSHVRRINPWLQSLLFAVLLHIGAGITAHADVVTLNASQDNTLYETADGSLSNGAGAGLFAGNINTGEARRGLIAFDLSSIPAGSTINSATLTLHVSIANPNAAARTITLHKVLADWGEGTSNSTNPGGGMGAPSTAGDATWLHTFFDSDTWSNAGGDFDNSASASQSVAGIGTYNWSSATLASDVQDWLDAPANNFGWLLLGDETANQTARRFDSRENGMAANRPQLTVDFTPPPSGAVMAVTPTQLHFGELQLGQSTSLSFDISNAGDLDLTVDGIILMDGADFILTAPATPFTLSPGSSQSVDVEFAPSGSGAASGTVEVNGDDPSNPVITVDLRGIGVAPTPGMDVQPAELAFGDHLLGQSTTMSFDISNTGTLDLTIDGLTLLDGVNFALAAPDTPFTLAPGTSQTIDVTYTPTTPGTHSATVEISGDDPNNPLGMVSLSGAGLLVVVDAGQQNPGTQTVSGSTQNVPLLQVQLDSGNETLSISSVTVAFTDQTGSTDASLDVSLIDDRNGNGAADSAEPVLATAPVNGSTDTLLLEPEQPFDIGPNATVNLLLTLDVTAAPGNASVLAAPTPRNLYSRLGWWGLFPSLIGILTLRRLRRRSPMLALGFLAIVLGLSLLLGSCSDDDDGGSQTTFTATIPANGISGQGTASGPFSAPQTAIAGATVTVSN